MHQRTREQLNVAQQELNSLQQQLNARDGGVSSPSMHTGLTGSTHRVGGTPEFMPTSCSDPVNAVCVLLFEFFFSYSSPAAGLQGGDEGVEELRRHLNEAKSRAVDLSERLEGMAVSLEQYRAMCLSLEEALEKEKQVTHAQ